MDLWHGRTGASSGLLPHSYVDAVKARDGATTSGRSRTSSGSSARGETVRGWIALAETAPDGTSRSGKGATREPQRGRGVISALDPKVLSPDEDCSTCGPDCSTTFRAVSPAKPCAPTTAASATPGPAKRSRPATWSATGDAHAAKPPSPRNAEIRAHHRRRSATVHDPQRHRPRRRSRARRSRRPPRLPRRGLPLPQDHPDDPCLGPGGRPLSQQPAHPSGPTRSTCTPTPRSKVLSPSGAALPRGSTTSRNRHRQRLIHSEIPLPPAGEHAGS